MRYRLLASCAILALIVLPILGAKIPRPAPELLFKLPNGDMMKLSQFKGKVVALEFMLTTCPHCKRTATTMQKLYAEYGPAGFQPLSVAINDEAEKDIPAYIAEQRLTYPVGLSNRDRAVDFLQHPIMMTLWVPQLVIIDKEGAIRGQYGGTDKFFQAEEQNMRGMVEKLLAE